jgi:hypothetical protein
MRYRTYGKLFQRRVNVGLLAGAVSMFATASFAVGVPSLPPVPSLPIGGAGPGGGGGPGGGPGGSGGPGSGSVTGPGGGGLDLSGPAPTFQGGGDGGVSGSSGPDAKWGDPLSTDLLGNGSVHARLKYYGESGALGTSQGVGINLSFPQ